MTSVTRRLDASGEWVKMDNDSSAAAAAPMPSAAIGWHVTWTSETDSGAEGPFTDLTWALARVRENALQMRVVTLAPTK